MESNTMKKVMELANDDRVVSVILNGSRTNPEATIDEDSDYDILMGVHNLASFLESDAWLDMFGEILIMQKPESMGSVDAGVSKDKEVYLMQFVDGTRLDLTLMHSELIQDALDHDSLSEILMDKEGILHAEPASDPSYQVNDLKLADIVNEFLWLSFYVMKGRRRNQIMYAQSHLQMMREEFMNLIVYLHPGNPGASYKYAQSYLNAYDLSRFKETFNADTNIGLKTLFELFETQLKKTDFDMTQFIKVQYAIDSQIF